jgi:amidohydrolase
MAQVLTALSPERIAQLKRQACQRVDALAGELIALADDIRANPELGFQEVRTVGKVQELLGRHGIASQTGRAGLATGLRAELGATASGHAGRPKVAIIAEYDALPGLGHACGHNTICTSALGAALAIQSVVGQTLGSAVLLGTPAEESAVDNAGGKVHMLAAGDFDDVDAAMMVHPNDRDDLGQEGSLAARGLVFEFHGRPAHAAAAPHLGINALDAVLQTYNAINALRQHVRSDARIHGIITHGGEAPNIVPKYAACRFRVRAADLPCLEELVERVINCARAGALATGARLEHHDFAPTYQNQLPNSVLAELASANFDQLGRAMESKRLRGGMGSTDFGNVSRRVPALCPYVQIAEPGTKPHTAEFEQAAGSAMAHRMILDSAKALAMTAIDLLSRPELVERAKAELAERLSAEKERRD